MMAAREPAADSGAVAGLAENHRRFLAFLERRVGDRDTAEEILQAAFVRGVERAGDIRDEERAVAWFYRILRRAVVDHWRSLAAERRGVEALSWELHGQTEPAPEVAGELCRCFEPLLGILKPGDLRQPLRGVRERGQPARATVTPRPNDRPKGKPP